MRAELERHERMLEESPDLKAICFTVVLGERTGNPVKVRCDPRFERDVGRESG